MNNDLQPARQTIYCSCLKKKTHGRVSVKKRSECGPQIGRRVNEFCGVRSEEYWCRSGSALSIFPSARPRLFPFFQPALERTWPFSCAQWNAACTLLLHTSSAHSSTPTPRQPADQRPFATHNGNPRDAIWIKPALLLFPWSRVFMRALVTYLKCLEGH